MSWELASITKERVVQVCETLLVTKLFIIPVKQSQNDVILNSLVNLSTDFLYR